MELENKEIVNSMPRIGDEAPHFEAKTTQGDIKFPEDYKGKWVILFSHPADFTPVCTTEFMTFASMQEEFKQIALQTIHDEGYSYNVNISIGNFEFPTKDYGDISLPAGFYDALRVEIGEAQGQNWWCVMFPPLCFVDVTSGVVPEDSKEQLENNLSEEEYALVSEDSDSKIQFKFKILEFFNKNGFITARK